MEIALKLIAAKCKLRILSRKCAKRFVMRSFVNDSSSNV